VTVRVPSAEILRVVTVGSRPTGETRDAIIAAIEAAGLDKWVPTRLQPGISAVPTGRLIRVIGARVVGRTSSPPDD
jgi:hypothetical protein